MTDSFSHSIEGESDPDVRFACIYARTSSPNQRYNHSIGEQIDQCWRHCEQRDWEVNYTFIDECISGGTIDRPKFQLMLEKAKMNYFNVIVIWKIDRFARSLADLINLERKLSEWNVNLSSVTELIDTTSAAGRFNFRNLASFAEFERELIGERTRMGLHGLARKHGWPNSQPPLGYDIDGNKKLKPNPDEVRLVLAIFSEYMETKSMPQLAYNLNQRGISTKKGNKWSAHTIHKILTNKIYVGSYNVAGFKDHVEEYRILDKEIYEKVSQIRNRYRRGRGKKPTVPKDRRLKTIDKVFQKYDKFLQDTSTLEVTPT